MQQPPANQTHSTADYERFRPPVRPQRKGSKKLVIILLAVMLLVVAGAAAYWFLLRSKPAAKPTVNPGATATSEQPKTTQIPTTTTHYDSSNLNLGFDYPQGWTVTDTAGSGKLTAVSQPVQLKDATNQNVTGQITLTVRNNQQLLTEFNAGSALAALESQKIAYTKPTASQRGNTYVSFLRYATDPSSAGLDGVYITGDAGYQVGQYIPKADIIKVDPVVSITFAKCSDAACSVAPTPLSIASSSWSDTALSGPLMAMLQSFSFQ